MHIEPGVVDGAKIILSFGTAAVAVGATVKVAADFVRENGLGALLTRSALAALMVFCFFEVFLHYPVGVSEVHLILGTTLFLFFGLGTGGLGLGRWPAGSGPVLRSGRPAAVRYQRSGSSAPAPATPT
jgi:hypothetical protein